MMREIGGYLEYEYNSGSCYHEGAMSLNSGRNCLRYVIKEFNIKKIYIPRLVCDCIVEVCKEENVNIINYNLDNKMRLVDFVQCDNSWVYIINYSGQMTDDDIKLLSKRYNNIIIDNSQAYFMKPCTEDIYIYTCRKYFGVPDGAYLYIMGNNNELRRDESYERFKHLLGRFERKASDFYENYKKNEELISTLPIRSMSLLTENILRGIDYKRISSVREKNFSYLNSRLKNINRLVVASNNGPYMYPLMVGNGDYLRKELQKKSIYIPQLWPNVLKNENEDSIEYKFARDIVYIPVDQRYTISDMEYIVNCIYKIKEEGDFI